MLALSFPLVATSSCPTCVVGGVAKVKIKGGVGCRMDIAFEGIDATGEEKSGKEIEVELKPETEYQFDIENQSTDPFIACSPGPVVVPCGCEVKLINPDPASGYGTDFDKNIRVFYVTEDEEEGLRPSGFEIRLTKGESTTKEEEEDDSGGNSPSNPASATPPSYEEDPLDPGEFVVIPPTAKFQIDLGSIAMGAGDTAPYRSAGVLSLTGRLGSTGLSSPTRLEYLGVEEVRVAILPALPKVTYLEAGTPKEMHLNTPTRLFRVTGYNGTAPNTIIDYTTATNTYVREYRKDTPSETVSVTLGRQPLSWWRIQAISSGISVEQSVKGVEKQASFVWAGGSLVTTDGPLEKHTTLAPLPGGEHWVTEITKRSGVNISRTLSIYKKIAGKSRLVHESRYPNPNNTANPVVTQYDYYVEGSGLPVGTMPGSLRWISYPGGSWKFYRYSNVTEEVFSPFESEGVLDTSPATDQSEFPIVGRYRKIETTPDGGSYEYVSTDPDGISESPLSIKSGSSSASSRLSVENASDDAVLPNGVPLTEYRGSNSSTICYSSGLAASSPHRWLAGKTVLTASFDGEAEYFEYLKSGNLIIETSITGVINDIPTGGRKIGGWYFHEVPNLSEQTIRTYAPHGLVTEQQFYHTGAGFSPAYVHERHFDVDGKYSSTTKRLELADLPSVTIHSIGRPDPHTVVEKDAAGGETTSKYDSYGNLLWTEKKEGGGVPAIRTTYEVNGLTSTVRTNGAVTSVTTADGLGRTVSTQDITGAVTSYFYYDGNIRTTLPGNILNYETHYLDGTLKSRYGGGQVPEFHSTDVWFADPYSSGYLRTRSTGSSSGHTLRRVTRYSDYEGRLRKVIKPSPANGDHAIQETYVYGSSSSDTLVAIKTTEVDEEGDPITGASLPTKMLFESSEPFYERPNRDAMLLGGLKISGLDLNGNDVLALNTTDRLTRREMKYELDADVVYRKIFDYRYPNQTGANPLITETRESVSFIEVGTGSHSTIRKVIEEPFGRSLTTTTVVTPATANVTVTVDDSATTTTADTLTTEINGYVQSVVKAGATHPATYVYDNLGRVERFTDHRNASTRYEYAANFQLTKTIDHLGRATTYAYRLPNETNAGKISTVTRPGGFTEITSYNTRGQVVGISGTGVYPRTYGYDAIGDMVTMQTSGSQTAVTRWIYQERTGLLQSKRYNDAGQPGGWSDFGYEYTRDGKVAKRTTGKGVITNYGYDPTTRDLVSIGYTNDSDLTPDVTFSNHDGFGRPREVSEARSGGSGAVGTDANTGTDSYTTTQTLAYQRYSGAVSTAYVDGHRWLKDVSLVHGDDDDSGRPVGFEVKVDDDVVSSQEYGYDDFSRVDEVSSPDLTAALSPLAGVDTVQGVSITLKLDEEVIHTRNLAVDLLGRTVGVVNKAGPNFGSLGNVASIGHGYDTSGRRADARREDGTRWDYSYNSRSEVTGAVKRTSGNQLVPGLSFGYGYDGMGNRITSTSGTGTGVSTRGYTPDVLNQYDAITHDGKVNVLTRSDATVTATATNATNATPTSIDNQDKFYGVRQNADSYSTYGKLVTTNLLRSGDAAGSVQTWVPRATVVPTYDLDGNLTWDGRWIYTWDGENRLVSMISDTNAVTLGGAPNITVKFAYDWKGRRIGKTTETTVGTTTTASHQSFLYDHWNMVAEWTRSSLTDDLSGAALQRTHLWGPDIASSAKEEFGVAPNYQAAGGVGGLLASTFHDGLSTYHFVPSYDANGNILAWNQNSTTPVQRMDYDPFGNAVMVEKFAGDTLVDKLPSFGFSTKYQDEETGVYYYGYRYYDSVTGRWLSRDPSGESGGLNLFAIASNKTTITYDVLGLYTDPGTGGEMPGPQSPDPRSAKPTDSIEPESCTIYVLVGHAWAVREAGNDLIRKIKSRNTPCVKFTLVSCRPDLMLQFINDDAMNEWGSPEGDSYPRASDIPYPSEYDTTSNDEIWNWPNANRPVPGSTSEAITDAMSQAQGVAGQMCSECACECTNITIKPIVVGYDQAEEGDSFTRNFADPSWMPFFQPATVDCN